LIYKESNMTKYYKLLALVLAILLISCKKDFLDKKPNQALLIPTTLADFQALLDNTGIMNTSPSLNLILADDILTTDAGWTGYRTPIERNTYLWKENPYEGNSVADWNTAYTQIFYANVVLDGLDKYATNEAGQNNYNGIKGSALFFRAFALYNLSQIFAKPYHKNTANSTLGLPIRTSSDINIKPERGNLEATYNHIIQDLSDAVSLLPEQTSFKSRPNKNAVRALFSRIYLSMGDYKLAEYYADEALRHYDILIDFNLLSQTSTAPFPRTLPNGNDEIIFYNYPIAYSFVNSSLTSIEPSIVSSYAAGDLRKLIFLRDRGNGIMTFKGYGFGLATPEMYLIRAECLARRSEIELAMADLNKLIKNRWLKSSIYKAFVATNQDQAIDIILKERRKELVYKGVRWSDLRRLNQTSNYSVILKRKVSGVEYELLPNSDRYVLPIPDNEIINGGIEQN